MAIHNFDALYAKYPAVIAEMSDTFTSHEFILRLAQQYQALYIEALYSYRNREREAPFMTVHSILARQLQNYPHLIREIDYVPSTDIFGQSNKCAKWQKVKATKSNNNVNKHGVDLSKLVPGKSVIRFYDDYDKAPYTGNYLGPGEEGWLNVRFGHKEWLVDPDYVLGISDPDPKWD